MMNFAKLLLHPGASEAMNGELPSTGSRIAFLLLTFAIVFVFEVAFPLFAYRRWDRLRNISRNLAITDRNRIRNLITGEKFGDRRTELELILPKPGRRVAIFAAPLG